MTALRLALLDVFEVLVGGHHAGRVQLGLRDGGADDVDPVEPGLLLDLRLLPLGGEAGIGDGDVEVLGHLVLVQDLAGLLPDLGGAGQPAGRSAGGDRGEQLLGGREEVFALAGALAGEGGVAAGDEPFAGEIG